MRNEILTASVLAWAAVTSFVYGFHEMFKRDIDVSRFAARPYDPSVDADLLQARKAEKKEKGMSISPSKLLLLSLGGMVLCAVLAYIVVGRITVALAVSLTGLFTPKLYQKWHKEGRGRLVTSQLEQAMEIMSAVLRTGGGIPAALEKAAQNIPEPLRTELTQTLAEIRLGVPTSEAFKNFSERVKLPETFIISMAVELKQSGMAVNLASVFQQVQDNIRSRKAFEQEVSSITAENRMAGWIVAAVPFITIAVVRYMSPEFISPLFEEPVGIAVFIVCVIIILIGILWIRNMADAEKLL